MARLVESPPNQSLPQTAAAMRVSRGLLSIYAAAAAGWVVGSKDHLTFDVMDGRHPRDWVAEAVARFGVTEVALRCAALLSGEADAELLPFLAGPAVRLADSGAGYWPRVWAARSLRYVWDERAASAVL